VNKKRGTDAVPPEGRDDMRRRLEKMPSQEQQKEIEKMGQRLQNLSPEQRERIKKRLQSMELGQK
jgi:hypothetical protein